MNELENHTIDVLRAMIERKSDNAISVEAIINAYYKYTSMPGFAKQIHKRIVDNKWAFPIEEDDGLILNESEVLTYLESVTTDQYIIDRCFDYLKRWDNYIDIDEMLDRQKLKLSDDKKRYFEAVMIKSGLVDSKSGGYYPVMKLNTEGIVALNNLTYSEYNKQSHIVENKVRNETGITLINYGTMSQSPVSQLSESIMEQDISYKRSKSGGMSGWAANHVWQLVVGVIVAVIAGYIIYRLGWQ